MHEHPETYCHASLWSIDNISTRGCGASIHREVQTPTWHSPEQPAVADCALNKLRLSPEGPSHLNSSLRITYIVHTSRPFPPAYHTSRIQHANALLSLQEEYLTVKGISNCCQQLNRNLPLPNKWPVSLPSQTFPAKSKFSASTISWFDSGFLEFQKKPHKYLNETLRNHLVWFGSWHYRLYSNPIGHILWYISKQGSKIRLSADGGCVCLLSCGLPPRQKWTSTDFNGQLILSRDKLDKFNLAKDCHKNTVILTLSFVLLLKSK